MRKQRISRLAFVLSLLVIAFLVLWTVEYADRIYGHLFLRDWANYRFVDNNVEITRAMRLWAVPIYVPVFVAAYASGFFALRLLRFMRRLELFEMKTVNALMALGAALLGVAVVDTYVVMAELRYLTQWNDGGSVPWRFIYDAGDITIGLAGLGFVLMGWVTREAMLIDQEMQEIV